MFAINATLNKSASSDSISLMSSMSMSPALSYITPDKCPSPKPVNIIFGTADPVEPLNFKKLEEGELEDEDKPFFLPLTFTMEHPAQIHINIEEFSNSHQSREVETLNKAANDAVEASDTASNISRIVRAEGSPTIASQPLAALYHSLHALYGSQQPNSSEKDKEVKPISESENSDDDEDSWSA
jgi:hypothetical protein